jgi:predicted porin
MSTSETPSVPSTRRPLLVDPAARLGPQRALRCAWLLASFAVTQPAAAIDFGPFSLNGFGKAEVQRGTNICTDCQRDAAENRQRLWADDLVYNKRFGNEGSHITLAQPYLGVKFDLGGGFKAFGLLSQRWRDGKEDLPGWFYDRNLGVSHEDWGSLRYGSMTTRGWSVADYPYGTNVGLAEAWGSSGAGYGLLSNALRYMSRKVDLADGDLVLELTHDWGKRGWDKNKPRFWELYAQYVKGDWVVDAMVQRARNGEPVAWGHAPFGGLTPFAADDAKLGSSGQSMAMVMSRYQISPLWEVSGGLRKNRWSGAYAVQTSTGPLGQWNNMFNVNWGGSLNGVPNPGYAATSVDVMLGLRRRMGPWTVSTGLVRLGKASTDNPSERGQSNTLTINTVGLNHDFGNGLQAYGLGGVVRYGRLGLAPLSMPANNAFTKVDSRVAQRGNWLGGGVVYTF